MPSEQDKINLKQKKLAERYEIPKANYDAELLDMEDTYAAKPSRDTEIYWRGWGIF